MADTRLTPIAGINVVADDDALQRGGDAPSLFVRDAVNVNITDAGKVELRPGQRHVTAIPYRNLWQSPLHRDTFGTLGDQWHKIDPEAWSSEALATIGEGVASHIVLMNMVCVAGPAGLFTYDGSKAQRLTLDTPAAPLVMVGEGSLDQGAYHVAVAWLRGTQESALSDAATVHVPADGALEVAFPMCLDMSVTGIRLYLSKPNGAELLRYEDFPVGSPVFSIRVQPALGAAAQFRHLSPMPTGLFLAYWRGRLLTARANVLRFSEAMAYHLHDERHGFIQMPQRITFVQPVDGGIWVGQVDHVAFLSGASPDQLSVSRKSARPPVPGSAMLVSSDILGGELSQGGGDTAVWLAENGYVVGTATGQLVELHSGVMRGISAQSGTSVVLERRLITAVT